MKLGLSRFRKPAKGLDPSDAAARRQAAPGQRTPVFSYYASQRQRDGQGYAAPRGSTVVTEEEAARRRVQARQIPTIIAIVLIVVSLAVASTLSGKPKVRVRVEGKAAQPALYRSSEEYETAAERALTGDLRNRSKLLIKREQIETAIEDSLPEVTSVRLATPLVSRQLIITIDTEAPGMVIRGQSGDYVVDGSGTVINPLEKALGSVDLPVVEDQTGTQLEVGKAALAAQDIKFITQLHRQLTSQKLAVSTMILPKNIANELHVRFEGSSYLVKYALNGDVRIQTGTYLAVKEDLEKQGSTPVEYLDVRVEGRAFYR